MLLLCSCAAKKQAVKPAEPQPEETAAMQWHTAQVTNTVLTLDVDAQRYNVQCLMQAVRDSMIVISIMPVMNMELLRLEITPDTAFVIDKVNRRYTKLPLNAAREEVVPPMTWSALQDFATGQTTGKQTSLGYSFREHTVRLIATYGNIAYDVPVNVRHIRLDRYQYMDINQLLLLQ